MKKILIADDDQDIRDVLRLVFERGGYHVSTANDGRAALEQAASVGPDVVLLDIMMPETHGLAVCHQIKNSETLRKTKVVILSCKSFAADRRQAEQAGADLFVSKPVDNQDLLLRIDKLLA